MGLNFMKTDKVYSQYEIGEYTYGSPKIESWKACDSTLSIGSFCSIARGVTIYLGGNHHSEWVSTSPLANYFYDNRSQIRNKLQVCSKGDVTIGNDVWIASDVTILSGVTIGDGSIIGAHSVVSKSVSPYTVVVGNPARFARNRFSEDVIKKLLVIRWWEWDIDKIKENIPLLLSEKVEDFVSKHFKKED